MKHAITPHSEADGLERQSDEEADGHRDVLCNGRASCQPQRRRDGAPEELCSHANVDVG